MRRFVICLLFLSMLIGCSAVSQINSIPNTINIRSLEIGRSGGVLIYNKPDSLIDGVSIAVDKNTVNEETKFEMLYYESFLQKPELMKPESMAIEFKFDAVLNKRVKITIPYLTENTTLTSFTLFKYDKSQKAWHFAGCTEIDTTAKTVSALIDEQGVYAVMSLEDDLPSKAETNFEVGWDTFNATNEFTKEYCHAVTSYAYWYYNYKRNVAINLNSKYAIQGSSDEKVSLLVAKAASWEFYHSQFTSAKEISAKTKLSGILAAKTIRTALAYENRPVVAVLDEDHTIIINKYQNNDFSYYDPFDNGIEQSFSYDSAMDELFYMDGGNRVVISKIGFFGQLTASNTGFNKIFNHFEKTYTNVASQMIGGNTGGSITVNFGSLAGSVVDVKAGAVSNDRIVIVDEIQSVPASPIDAMLISPLYRITGPELSMFNNPIEISIPYKYFDTDDNKIIDNTLFSLSGVHFAAYNYETNCWANVEYTVDSVNKIYKLKSSYASDFAMFGFEPLAVPAEPEVTSSTVFETWPTSLYSPAAIAVEELIENCSIVYKLNSLDIVAFENTGFRNFKSRILYDVNMTSLPASGIDWSEKWYSMDLLMNEANSRGLNINLIVSCFKDAIDDVEAPDSQAAYIVNTLLPFIIDNFPTINAIVLKDVQKQSVGASKAEMDMLTAFVRCAREVIGKKSDNNIKLILEIEKSNKTDCNNDYGQRLTEFAKYADYLLLKLFDDRKDPFGVTSTTLYATYAKVVCSTSNNTGLIANISSQMNTVAGLYGLQNQIRTILNYNVNGFSIDEYATTEAKEWNEINKYIP